VVPCGDEAALAAALAEVLAGGPEVAARRERGERLAAAFGWEHALAPLVRFLRSPRSDPTKERFAFRPATEAPADRFGFRLRRWLDRLRTEMGG